MEEAPFLFRELWFKFGLGEKGVKHIFASFNIHMLCLGLWLALIHVVTLSQALLL